jgi:hypothetical protein
MMAIAIVFLLKLYQEFVAERLPAISAFAVVVSAVLAVAGTHDWFARDQAQLTAIGEVMASGVARTEIQEGMEYDGWTQIEAGGYVNSPLIQVPAGAYHANPYPLKLPEPCRLDFAIYTPAIHPRFTTAFDEMWCLRPSKFRPVSYRTWLPPFERTIDVQEIPTASP